MNTGLKEGASDGEKGGGGILPVRKKKLWEKKINRDQRAFIKGSPLKGEKGYEKGEGESQKGSSSSLSKLAIREKEKGVQ